MITGVSEKTYLGSVQRTPEKRTVKSCNVLIKGKANTSFKNRPNIEAVVHKRKLVAFYRRDCFRMT